VVPASAAAAEETPSVARSVPVRIPLCFIDLPSPTARRSLVDILCAILHIVNDFCYATLDLLNVLADTPLYCTFCNGISQRFALFLGTPPENPACGIVVP